MAKKAQWSLDPEIAKLKYRVVNSHSKLARMVSDLSRRNVFALDTETDRLDALTAVLELITISTADHNYVIPFKYINGCLTRREVVKAMKTLLREKKVYFWNAKYDLHVLYSYGLIVPKYYDAMGMAHCFDPDDLNSLDHRAKKVLGYGKAAKFRDVKKRLDKTGNPKEFFLYAARDSQATYELGEHYRKALSRNHLWDVFVHQENKTIKEFFRMERRGIDVDLEYMKEVHVNVTEQIEALDKRMLTIAGSVINYNSRKQLAELLFEKFKLPIQGTSEKTGDPSTNRETLNKITGLVAANRSQLDGIAFCKRLLVYRKLEKLRSTYTDMDSKKGMISKVREGKIHGSFNPFGAATGRASSSNPNMQNISRNPKRDMDEGGNLLNRYPGNRAPGEVYLRDAFIARGGDVLIGVDFSQIELRLIAHFSEDPVMLGVYHSNGDIHEKTRSGCDLPHTEEGRVQAKAANFGLHYGMADVSFAKQVGKSEKWANKFISNYWSLYSGVKNWQRELVSYCKGAGEVRCLTGRRRLLPEINSSNFGRMKSQERVAINTIVQGSAADIIKNATINMGEDGDLKKLKCKMLLQVHDELIFRVPKANAADACPIIERIMETPITPLRVPLVAKPAIGNCWGDIH